MNQPAGQKTPEVVVVVDDDPALLHALTFALGVEGFSVRPYPDAASLLTEPSLPAHGCLVIDYRLPGLDGLDLLERLRARGVTLPAVLITTATPKILKRAAAAGVPVVEKPLLNGMLFSLVHELLAAPASR